MNGLTHTKQLLNLLCIVYVFKKELHVFGSVVEIDDKCKWSLFPTLRVRAAKTRARLCCCAGAYEP